MFQEPISRRCSVCGKQFLSRYSVNFCSYSCHRKHRMSSCTGGLAHARNLDIISNGISTRDRCKILLHPNEGLRHFMAKALVCRILFERKRSFVCEASIENGNKVDVCDLSMQIAYEIEPRKADARLDSKFGKYGVSPAIKDIIIIPYEELPDDLNLAYERLKELVV